MNSKTNKVCLIIPCYNESNRLDMRTFLNFANENLNFLFVDDGSKDNTFQFIKNEIAGREFLQAVQMPQNGGKSAAIYYGFRYLQITDLLKNFDWIGYWDADLATPLWEIENMIQYADLLYPQCRSIFASRVYRLGGKIIRTNHRHYLGRVFATFIYAALKVQSYDSQCGAKLFHYTNVQQAFSKPFISKWIFDVEIMLRLNQSEIVEYPLKYWKDIPGSKVKVLREIFRVLNDILKIRKEYSQKINLNELQSK